MKNKYDNFCDKLKTDTYLDQFCSLRSKEDQENAIATHFTGIDQFNTIAKNLYREKEKQCRDATTSKGDFQFFDDTLDAFYDGQNRGFYDEDGNQIRNKWLVSTNKCNNNTCIQFLNTFQNKITSGGDVSDNLVQNIQGNCTINS